MQPTKKAKLDINYCTVQQLCNVVDIDTQLAEAIIRYRRQRRFLESVNDLANVTGMTRSKLQTLRDNFEVLYEKQAMPSALIARMNTPTSKPSGLTNTNDYYEKSLSMLASAKVHESLKNKMHERTGSARKSSEQHLYVHQLHEKHASKCVSESRSTDVQPKEADGHLTLYEDTLTYSNTPQSSAVTNANRSASNGTTFSSKPSIQIQKSSSGNNIQFSCTFNKSADAGAINKSNNANNVSECNEAFYTPRQRPRDSNNNTANLRVKSANFDKNRDKKSATIHKAYVETVTISPIKNNLTMSRRHSQLLQQNLKQHNRYNFENTSTKRSVIVTWVNTVNAARKITEPDQHADGGTEYALDLDVENVESNCEKSELSPRSLSHVANDQRKACSPVQVTDKNNFTNFNDQNNTSETINALGKDTDTTKSSITKQTSTKCTKTVKTVNKTNQKQIEQNARNDTTQVNTDSTLSDGKSMIRKVHFPTTSPNCAQMPTNYHQCHFANSSTTKAITTYNNASQVCVPMMGPYRFLTCRKLFNTLPTSVFAKTPHSVNFHCPEPPRREQIHPDKYNVTPANSFIKTTSNKTSTKPYVKYACEPLRNNQLRRNIEDPQKYLRTVNATTSRKRISRNGRRDCYSKQSRDSCRVM